MSCQECYEKAVLLAQTVLKWEACKTQLAELQQEFDAYKDEACMATFNAGKRMGELTVESERCSRLELENHHLRVALRNTQNKHSGINSAQAQANLDLMREVGELKSALQTTASELSELANKVRALAWVSPPDSTAPRTPGSDSSPQ